MLNRTIEALRLPLAISAAVILLAASSATRAGVVVTDGVPVPKINKSNDTTSQGSNVDPAKGSAATGGMTPTEQAIYVWTSSILNSHYVDVGTEGEPAKPPKEGGTGRAPATIVANLDADDFEGGCAATPLSALAGLGSLLLLWRRRRR